MECPACGRNLTEKSIYGLILDACEGGCGGIWFDNFELKRVDEPHESRGEPLLDLAVDPNLVVDREKRRSCPKCDSIVMMRHFFTVRNEIEVDECAGCGGVWLDAGELAAIRRQYNTEAERREAAEKHFSGLFGDQLAGMARKSKEDLAKAQKFARALRFILPSYYLPGKQEGGAL
jgi:Zn-finger nucleic acid-binding protein